MARETGTQTAVVALAVGVVVGAVFVGVLLGVGAPGGDDPESDDQQPDTIAEFNQSPNQSEDPASELEAGSVQQFGSAEAFKSYIRAGSQRSVGWRTTPVRTEFDFAVERGVLDAADGVAAAPGDGESAGGAPDRVGETNVQVAGLDEPDIVKTDGENFYYSPQYNRYVRPIEPQPIEPQPDEPVRDVAVPPRPQPAPSTNVVDITEPADPSAIAEVNTSGKLLQTGDTLVSFEQRRIVGYDVSDPANPTEAWSRPLNASLVTARETGGQLYVVTQTYVGPQTPCPIEPLGGAVPVDCGEIYGPDRQTSADATYTAFSIDAASGDVDDSVSFVGTGADTVVYVSHDSLYVTYTTRTSESELRLSWANESEAVPEGLAERISEIDSYDISEQSKQREIRRAVQNWSDEGDLREDYNQFLERNQQNLTQTSIVRTDIDDTDLTVAETGTVPGEPLDQFALDEYEGTLRVTTTIPRVGDAESTNSLYVLDNTTLERESEVTGMGEGQRVYAVRYVGDTAYVVTFRQVDPFYVIDFEEPTEPELLGELKLPGFSTYLHSIDDNSVIGIGEQDWRVKAVLFDVSDPTNPTVGDDLVLDESYSAVDESHHAFTIDRRHEVFFLPAGNTGKVIDYSNGTLDVVAEVTADEQVTRARYVDNYLYVFAGDEVIVLDQTTWERTTTLTVGDNSRDG